MNVMNNVKYIAKTPHTSHILATHARITQTSHLYDLFEFLKYIPRAAMTQH